MVGVKPPKEVCDEDTSTGSVMSATRIIDTLRIDSTADIIINILLFLLNLLLLPQFFLTIEEESCCTNTLPFEAN